LKDTMTILDFAPTARRSRAPQATAVQLHDALWRITRPTGEVLGYVERLDGGRYRAKRMITRERRFVGIGDFWRFSDAMECFAI
jgi:hypothetical protein